MLGTHAFQVALATKDGKADAACYPAGALTDAAARRARDAPGRAPEGRREGGARVGGGPALDLRPEGRPRAAPRARACRSPTRCPSTSSRRWLAAHTKARPRPGAGDRQPLPDEPRGGARRGSPAGALRLLRRPRPAGVPRPARPAGHGRRLPRDGPRARGQELCASPVGLTAAEWQIAGRKNWNWGEKNLGIRDDKVLARELLEEPDVKALVPADPRAARAADRGHRPLVHDAAPLVDAGRLRAGRDRDLRAREPGGRVPAVPGRRAHLDARRSTASTPTSSPGSRSRCCSW